LLPEVDAAAADDDVLLSTYHQPTTHPTDRRTNQPTNDSRISLTCCLKSLNRVSLRTLKVLLGGSWS
jgi:hypothetical protein